LSDAIPKQTECDGERPLNKRKRLATVPLVRRHRDRRETPAMFLGSD
jgi:hypothetical protein